MDVCLYTLKSRLGCQAARSLTGWTSTAQQYQDSAKPRPGTGKPGTFKAYEGSQRYRTSKTCTRVTASGSVSGKLCLLKCCGPSALYRPGQLPLASRTVKLHAMCSKQFYKWRKVLLGATGAGGVRDKGFCLISSFGKTTQNMPNAPFSQNNMLGGT